MLGRYLEGVDVSSFAMHVPWSKLMQKECWIIRHQDEQCIDVGYAEIILLIVPFRTIHPSVPQFYPVPFCSVGSTFLIPNILILIH